MKLAELGLIGRHASSEAGGGGYLPPLRRGMACRQRRPHLSLPQRRVMTAIEICRTAALGGHVERCEDCAHTRIAYNSCRNRHCPKCQWRAAQAWLEAREAELLPVPYFHVVFTLPAKIGAIAYQNKAKVYGLLFTAAAETLTTIAADPKHLGADIGVTAVLHTWGQNLDHHPHVHCIVPGGGLSPDGDRWIAVPAELLRAGARALALVPAPLPRRSRQLHAAGELQFFGDLAGSKTPPRSDASRAAAQEGVGGLRQAAVRRARAGAGLSRPLHPPRRHLQSPAARDRRRQRQLPLEGLPRGRQRQVEGDAAAAGEFMRRFLLHVLPDGFHRIRHYGLFANGHRAEKLALCRELLDVAHAVNGRATTMASTRRRRATALPVLRRPHADHRDLRAWSDATH